MLKRLVDRLPTLEREQRIALLERVEVGAHGNLYLNRKSVTVTMLGLLTGFAVSVVMGFLNPGFEPSLEIEARGTPDILDLGVAMRSGFVAAYALGRPGVASTLAGVAIAAALVPPLCVVGIGLTNDRPLVAANSAILLLTNLVAIILSAAGAFKMLGVRSSATSGGMRAWAPRVALLLVMLTLLVTIGRVSIEPASSINIILAAKGRVPAGAKDNLTRLVHEVRGGDPSVRIIALQEALEN